MKLFKIHLTSIFKSLPLVSGKRRHKKAVNNATPPYNDIAKRGDTPYKTWATKGVEIAPTRDIVLQVPIPRALICVGYN